MKLKQVTITGADDSVNYHDLYELSRQFPFVEWGVLLSKNSEGYPRFPTLNWLEGFIAEKHPEVHLSGHLCGTWVRDLIDGGTLFMDARSREIRAGFERFQLNFHASRHPWADIIPFIDALVFLSGVRGQQVIFQLDGVNDLLYHRARSQYGRSRGLDAVCLYDVSGGVGILPEEWAKPMGDYCGYAGGLSPDNLEKQLALLYSIVGQAPIWVDAETHLRSEGDKQFDLNKVAKFLEIARPWVVS